MHEMVVPSELLCGSCLLLLLLTLVAELNCRLIVLISIVLFRNTCTCSFTHAIGLTPACILKYRNVEKTIATALVPS